MQHSFDVELAKEYGIAEAILLNNFEYWIGKNKANNVNFYDGFYWTYNSTRAFNELFPYLSQRQIQNALKHLRDEGILQTGNYNKSSYDRTLWYAFTKKGISIMQKCKMEDVNMSNGLCENVTPIPDINTDSKNTDINTDNKKSVSASQIEKEFNKLWEAYPRKQGKANALKAYTKARKCGVEYQAVLDGVYTYAAYIKRNKVEDRYIKQGSTWFNQHCWEDDFKSASPSPYDKYEDPELDEIF